MAELAIIHSRIAKRQRRTDEERTALLGRLVRITVLTGMLLLLSWVAEDWRGTAAEWLNEAMLVGYLGLGGGLILSAIRKIAEFARKPSSAACADSDGANGSIVIDEPELQLPVKRGIEAFLSMGMWALFINLLQPILTVILWLLGIRLFHEHVFSLSAIESTVFMMSFFTYFGLTVLLLFASWASWNYMRYGRLERRKPKPPVSDAEVALFYGVPLKVVVEAKTLKAGIIAVTDGEVKFKGILGKCKDTVAALILALFFLQPVPAAAATTAVSLAQLGYESDIVVTGSQTSTSLAFPLPRLPLQPGSAVNLVIEPGRYLNDASIFNVFINDRLAGTYSAGQLKARPNVQVPLAANAGFSGPAKITVSTNMFVTDKICTDYLRGHLTYSIRNSSAVTINYAPPAPRTVQDFLATVTGGLLVIIPDKPTLSEISAGAWAYGVLQKKYHYLPVRFVFERERGQYPGLSRVWVATKNNLPANMKKYADGLHLAFADTLLVTTEDDEGLPHLVKNLAGQAVLETVPNASLGISGPNQAGEKVEAIHFGNNAAQNDILTVPIDFYIYPAYLPNAPRSLKLRLDGRYSPSNTAGKKARMDVYFNRTLIHSELLDDSGTFGKEIALPSSQALKARNILNVEFVYPLETAHCKVYGTVQSAQILRSSFFEGVDRFPVEQHSWQSIGMLFNKNGVILLGDSGNADLIRAVAETVALLNKQLPADLYAFPAVQSVQDYKPAGRADYLLFVGLADSVPEAYYEGLPLQRSKDFTIWRKEDQTQVFRYQPDVNTVLGQIGQYRGIPFVSITASLDTATLRDAIRNLQHNGTYRDLSGNIFIFVEKKPVLSVDTRSFRVEGEGFKSEWLLWVRTAWQKAVRWVGSYQTPLLLGFGAVVILVIGQSWVFSRRKR